jgi:hypothetical protein
LLTEEDEALVPALRADLLQLQQERAAAAADLEALQRVPADRARREQEVELALAQLARLKEVLKSAEPTQVQAALRELISHIELWFDHDESGREKRCRFAGGLVYLRTDTEGAGLISTHLSNAPGRGRCSRSGGPVRG